VREVKEKLCFVSLDFQADKTKAESSQELAKDYELPDGQVVKVNGPRFTAPEGLFFPDHIKQGSEDKGFHTMTHASINDCDIDVRRDLF